MKITHFSMGIGDRFGQQGEAQLGAFFQMRKLGVEVAPVWNKSNREHQTVHTAPASVRAEADSAVRARGWTGPWFVDADHINLKSVDGFLEASDFFTLDVADYIGQPASRDSHAAFLARTRAFKGTLRIPGLAEIEVTDALVAEAAGKYLYAVQEAAHLYRHIAKAKGEGNFVTEVSMDETDRPQTPLDLFFILLALAEERVPVQTLAPKFTGRFNKGVDYVGDVSAFEKEFHEDLAVIRYATQSLALPADLKLSVHSGSDKFALYGPIRRALRRYGAGLHLKTAGTTWLAEVTGLALADRDGLDLVKGIYLQALQRFDELARPYATVIDIDAACLPSVGEIQAWDGPAFAAALDHNPADPRYNPHFRQLMHVSYKVAAELGDTYLQALRRHRTAVGALVENNLFARHLKPLFL